MMLGSTPSRSIVGKAGVMDNERLGGPVDLAGKLLRSRGKPSCE